MRTAAVAFALVVSGVPGLLAGERPVPAGVLPQTLL